MKLSEFRKLVREEVNKMLTEARKAKGERKSAWDAILSNNALKKESSGDFAKDDYMGNYDVDALKKRLAELERQLSSGEYMAGIPPIPALMPMIGIKHGDLEKEIANVRRAIQVAQNTKIHQDYMKRHKKMKKEQQGSNTQSTAISADSKVRLSGQTLGGYKTRDFKKGESHPQTVRVPNGAEGRVVRMDGKDWAIVNFGYYESVPVRVEHLTLIGYRGGQ